MEEEKRMLDELNKKLEELVAGKERLESSKVELEKKLDENIKRQREIRDELTKLLMEEKEISVQRATAEKELGELNEKIARLTKVREELKLLWKVE